MTIEAYYPNPLPFNTDNIDEDLINDLLLDIRLELGRLDGMLRFPQKKEILRGFLKAEEILSAAALEVSELNFEEYMDKLLDRGYEADNLLEMRFLLDYYDEAERILQEKDFSIHFLDEFNKALSDNLLSRRLRQTIINRERQPWLTA